MKSTFTVLGGYGGFFVLMLARIVRTPGFGSCLCHSLVYGITGFIGFDLVPGKNLRSEIAAFMQQNPSFQIAGDTIENWIKQYAN